MRSYPSAEKQSVYSTDPDNRDLTLRVSLIRQIDMFTNWAKNLFKTTIPKCKYEPLGIKYTYRGWIALISVNNPKQKIRLKQSLITYIQIKNYKNLPYKSFFAFSMSYSANASYTTDQGLWDFTEVSQKFYNTLVTRYSIWQPQFLLPWSRRWRTNQDWEKSNSTFTFRALLAGFASMVWSTASDSMILGPPDLPWSCNSSGISSTIKLLHRDHLHLRLSHLVASARFVLSNQQFLNYTSLYAHLYCFQIPQEVKQCTTCQRTNYHDTSNYMGYLLQHEMLRLCAAN